MIHDSYMTNGSADDNIYYRQHEISGWHQGHVMILISLCHSDWATRIDNSLDVLSHNFCDDCVFEKHVFLWVVSAIFSSAAAVVNCYCVVIAAAVIVLGLGALFLLFVLLYFQRVASHSYKTLRPGGGRYSIYPWVGRCTTAPHSLTLFKTNIAEKKSCLRQKLKSRNLD